MMKPLSIFDISGRAMSAQQVRLNAVASNLANVNTISKTPENAYRAIRPVFEAEYPAFQEGSGIATVSAVDVQRSQVQPEKRYAPSHPLADNDGYIYASNVDSHEEMVDMLEASRQYQNNIEVVNTTRQMLMRTIDIIKT